MSKNDCSRGNRTKSLAPLYTFAIGPVRGRDSGSSSGQIDASLPNGSVVYLPMSFGGEDGAVTGRRRERIPAVEE